LRRARIPQGLSAYTALHDWPGALQPRLAHRGCADHNAGLGLRWEAALHEIEAYHGLPKRLRHDVTAAFGDAVEAELAAHPQLRPVLDGRRPDLFERTIFPIVIGEGSAAGAAKLWAALREPLDAHPGRYYLGQPVEVGAVSALRVCATMPLI